MQRPMRVLAAILPAGHAGHDEIPLRHERQAAVVGLREDQQAAQVLVQRPLDDSDAADVGVRRVSAIAGDAPAADAGSPRFSTYPRMCAGLPATMACGGTSCMTTAPAPTIACWPITRPGRIVAFAPIAAPCRTTVAGDWPACQAGRSTRW